MELFYYLGATLLQAADFWLWGALGLFILAASVWLIRRFRVSQQAARIGSRLAGGALALVGILFLAFSAYQVWYTHRPLPNNIRQVLFDGITYIRDVRSEPRPLVIHVVTIDLNTPGLRFLVTPGAPGQEFALDARTTSQFLDEFDLQLAINGDFFEPWIYNGLWDYYPHVGDPVNVTGLSSSRGVSYGKHRPGAPAIYLSEANAVSVNQPVGDLYNAVSGNIIFVQNGASVAGFGEEYHLTTHPRTAAGLDESAETLLLMVVDGRQPGYSEGVSIAELADIAIVYGAYMAVNLDGGGSSTLVMEGADGLPVLLNSPIDQRIPGRERAVGNHLGVYVGR
jgi:hypothetical protein